MRLEQRASRSQPADGDNGLSDTLRRIALQRAAVRMAGVEPMASAQANGHAALSSFDLNADHLFSALGGLNELTADLAARQPAAPLSHIPQAAAPSSGGASGSGGSSGSGGGGGGGANAPNAAMLAGSEPAGIAGGSAPRFNVGEMDVAEGEDPYEENTQPEASDDEYHTAYNEPLVIEEPGVLENDDDADTDPITAVKKSDPTSGSLEYFNATGEFKYIPDPTTSGTVTFTYAAYDGVEESDPATVTIYVQKVNLTIHNGQEGDAVADEDEETVGAFTVTNWNDTDGDGVTDTDVYEDGVPNEVDLMKLIIDKPLPDIGGSLTLTPSVDGVPSEYVDGWIRLWEESTKENQITDYDFATSELPKTVWVEIRQPSDDMRDMQVEATYNEATDTVTATGIWVEQTGFRTSQVTTTLTDASINTNPGSNQIEVANPGGFAVGDHIILFSDADDGVPRETFDITAINGLVFSLDAAIGSGWAAGDEVRIGLSQDADRDLHDHFSEVAGGKLGAFHVSPLTNNGMEMEFRVIPSGIGSEPGVVFDITRQKESIAWTLDNGTWSQVSLPGQFPSSFPNQVESPNDDGVTGDEDNTPQNDHIYSFDVPGFASDDALHDRSVRRANFYEFVRVKFDGTSFSNQNNLVEGSRASSKIPWRSRLDVVEETATGKWQRNAAAPAGEHEIPLGHKNLLQNDPTQ